MHASNSNSSVVARMSYLLMWGKPNHPHNRWCLNVSEGAARRIWWLAAGVGAVECVHLDSLLEILGRSDNELNVGGVLVR